MIPDVEVVISNPDLVSLIVRADKRETIVCFDPILGGLTTFRGENPDVFLSINMIADL